MGDSLKIQCELSKMQNLKAAGGYRAWLDIPSIYAAEAAILFVMVDKPGMIAEATIRFIEAEPKAVEVGRGL